jgi:transcription-repair coupling factor (superfamily II helicase)
VEAELQATAAVLVTVAREREAAEAPRLVPPTRVYRRFVDRFPYTETDDQIRAIEAVLRDLASGRPMDRLAAIERLLAIVEDALTDDGPLPC